MSALKRPRWKFQRDAAKRGQAYATYTPVERRVPTPRGARYRGPQADTLHGRLVLQLLRRPAVFADGFMREVGRALRVDGVTEREWQEETRGLRVIPDAFKIDPQALKVTVYEVEVTSFVSREKMDAFVELFWIIDEYEWTLDLVRVDQWGNETQPLHMFLVHLQRTAIECGQPPPVAEFVANLADCMGIEL